MRPLRFDANLGWLFTELPFEQRFDAAAAAGFTGVEYGSPYDFPAESLKRRLSDAGLEQVLINTPAGPAGSPTGYGSACDPGSVTEFRDGFEHALAYADVLASPLVHLLGGIVPDGVTREHALSVYVGNVAWAAERAAGLPVRVVLEAINHVDAPGFVLDSQEQAAGVLRLVAADNVGLLLDLYHCQVQQGGVADRMTTLMPHLAHVQVADPPSRTEPGSGELDWGLLLGRLLDLGYDGWVGCEYRPARGTLAGLGWLDAYLRPRT